jgi:hypothetical protein
MGRGGGHNWPFSASEIYTPCYCRLSVTWVPTFADRGCRVVSVTDPYSHILGFSRPPFRMKNSIICITEIYWRQDSLVSVPTRLHAGGVGFDSRHCHQIFLSSPLAPDGSRVHPASYTMLTRPVTPGVKEQGLKARCLPPWWSYTFTPHTSSCRGV